MSQKQETGVFQLENGYWGYRFILTVNGKKKAQKRVKYELGNHFKNNAIKAEVKKHTQQLKSRIHCGTII